MYNFNFKNFQSIKKTPQPTNFKNLHLNLNLDMKKTEKTEKTENSEKTATRVNPSPRVMVNCSYCNSSEHNISGCPIDNDLIKLVSSVEEPNFKSLSVRVLKKMATQMGVKTSLPKIHLELIMKKQWLNNKREREEEENKLRQELAAIKINNLIEDCPICMEKIEGSSSSTPCGHRFCTSCFVKSVVRNNKCPMCRGSIILEEEYNNISRPTTETTTIDMNLANIQLSTEGDIIRYMLQYGIENMNP